MLTVKKQHEKPLSLSASFREINELCNAYQKQVEQMKTMYPENWEQRIHDHIKAVSI